jgi:hypothetical protein
MFGELEDDQTALFFMPVSSSYESRKKKKKNAEKSAQDQGTSSAQRTPSVGPQ